MTPAPTRPPRLRRSTWDRILARLGSEIRYVAWRTEWAAGRLWCRHSVEAGAYLHEFGGAECAAMTGMNLAVSV